MNRGAAALAGLVVGVAVIGLAWLARTEERRAANAPPRETAPTTTGARPGNSTPEAEAPLGPPASREEGGSITVALPEEDARALGEAATAHAAVGAKVKAAVSDARAKRLAPGDLGTRLHDVVGNGAAGGAAVLAELRDERDPAIALKLAQALAATLDDPTLRAQTVEVLEKAPPAARAVGLLALLGRRDPEVVAFAARSFTNDDPEARATAGFLLEQTFDALDGPRASAVLEAARKALADPRSPERLREEALGLIGRAGAPASDVGLLERALLEDPSVAVRGRAFQGLALAGDPARIRIVLERALADERNPEELRQAIRSQLARPAAPR